MSKLTFNAEALCVSLMIAAELLGISRGLCYRLVHEGQIPSVRLGRRILIPVAALNDMLDVNRRGVSLCLEENEKQQTGTEQSSVVKMGDMEPPSG